MELRNYLRTIPDFPRKGILFYDISPLLADAGAFREAIDRLCEPFADAGVKSVCAIEARGFLFATAMAYRMCWGIVPVRKPGKLPGRTLSEAYALEYGTSELHVHADAIREGDAVLVFDDLLATGGTAAAVIRLVERLRGRVVGIEFLVELAFLKGREALADRAVTSLIRIDD